MNDVLDRPALVVRRPGLVEYRAAVAGMVRFTDQRGEATPDEILAPASTRGSSRSA